MKAAMSLCSKCGEEYQQESPCEKCMTENNGILFNEVLAYCQCFLRNFNVKEVADAVERLFQEEDVVQARKFLLENCSSIIPPASAISEVKYRRTTVGRSASHAYANDVVAALYEIISHDECPKFAVLDLSKMPVVKPMTNGGDHDERILRLEKYLAKLEERMDVTDNKVDEVQRASRKSYASVSSPDLDTVSFPVASSSASLVQPPPATARSVPQSAHSSQQSSRPPAGQSSQSGHSASSSQSASAEGSISGEGGWQRRREDHCGS